MGGAHESLGGDQKDTWEGHRRAAAADRSRGEETRRAQISAPRDEEDRGGGKAAEAEEKRIVDAAGRSPPVLSIAARGLRERAMGQRPRLQSPPQNTRPHPPGPPPTLRSHPHPHRR